MPEPVVSDGMPDNGPLAAIAYWHDKAMRLERENAELRQTIAALQWAHEVLTEAEALSKEIGK